MGLTARQKQIAEIVRAEGPITGQRIADQLHVTRAALRSDLAILIMSGIIDARPKVGYYFIGRSTLGLLTEEVSDILVSDIQSTPVVIQNTKSAYEAIISMFYYEERSLADIAYVTGSIPSTVGSQLSRIRKKLYRIIKTL